MSTTLDDIFGKPEWMLFFGNSKKFKAFLRGKSKNLEAFLRLQAEYYTIEASPYPSEVAAALLECANKLKEIDAPV